MHARINDAKEKEMQEKARSVSIAAAQREYIDALKVLAVRRKVRVADLVRSAVDAMFAQEIEQAISYQSSFFVASDANMHQNNVQETE